MARITVRFYGLLVHMAETDRVDLEAENLQELVEQLEDDFGERLRDQLARFGLKEGITLPEYFLLLLNGRTIVRKRLDQIKLVPGDILNVFLPAAGG